MRKNALDGLHRVEDHVESDHSVLEIPQLSQLLELLQQTSEPGGKTSIRGRNAEDNLKKS